MLGAIVVMPEGGPGGWFADWWNNGERGGPSWECRVEVMGLEPTAYGLQSRRSSS
jgi:diacylglycerol O-acyltransferase/trehalose O-mycolyltransferase